MSTRRNIRITTRNTAATARNTKQIIRETQRQTAIVSQVEAQRYLQQSRHEATLQLAEQARQRQAQREFDFRYATDEVYRVWVDSQRAELERQRVLAAQAWADGAPLRAEHAMALARIEQDQRLAQRSASRTKVACIAGVFLLIMTINAPLAGSLFSATVLGFWLLWRFLRAQNERTADALALDKAQRTAALAALLAEDTEWVNRQMEFFS